MGIFRQVFSLWNVERQRKGTTLHRRLSLFFASATAVLLLSFALLLSLFGITGREETALQNYFSLELTGIVEAVAGDFGSLSVDGIHLAETIAARSGDFFRAHGIAASELAAHPELLEPFLSEHAQALIDVAAYRPCGGAFMLLDATVRPEDENAAAHKAGIFIKKTQPTSTQAVGVKLHWLRGPAEIARSHGIELLGQWKMEYDTAGQAFFSRVMETARSNPALPLSRLYYWSERITLKGNSEAGFLLCVPLRSEDGTVFGLCGIEVSDRMFKTLYSPTTGTYESAFAVAAPLLEDRLQTSKGIVAGNYYLSAKRMDEDLRLTGGIDGFDGFSATSAAYGGKLETLRLYPSNSAFREERWALAVLMQESVLQAARSGNSHYFIIIVGCLLLISLLVSVFISRHYLKPVMEALELARKSGYEGQEEHPYLEIHDLLAFLAQKDREHEEELRRLAQRHQSAQEKAAKAQSELSRMAERQRAEIDPDSFAMFLENLKTLTRREREVFDLYLAGRSAREIVECMGFSDNALKYHNKNLYSKLGVKSRKDLLLYAARMRQDADAGANAAQDTAQ